MGGLGKTQLAVEFAYRYGNQFQGVHWLNLADPTTLDSEIASCGQKMGLDNWPDDQPSQVALTEFTWKSQGPRLLILDNFEDVAHANDILPRFRHSSIRILVTSRRSDWLPTTGLNPILLELFSPTESLNFLKRSLIKRKDNDDDLNTLSERLGHLPLALELASRYLNGHIRLSVTDYLAQTKEALEHASMNAWKKDVLGLTPTQHDTSLLSTFALSWLALKDETAQKMFQSAGYLAPNTAIPLEIFERTLEISSEQCDEALTLLYGLGLLRETESQPTIHPLLAEYARGLSFWNVEILMNLINTLVALSDEALDTGLPIRFIFLRPHMPSIATHAEILESDLTRTLWRNYGSHLYEIADFPDAQAAFEHTLKIDEANLGEDHSDIAETINHLGVLMLTRGDFVGARTAFERVLKIDEASFGPDHPAVARDINNLGKVLQDLGDFKGARSSHERALKIDEASLGPDHPKVATDFSNLGLVLHTLGDFMGARAAYENALKIDEATFGSDHPDVATLINNLGGVMQDLGNLDAARAAYERALKIDEACFGPDHPNVARDVNNLGLVLQDLGNLDGARASHERALKIYEAFFGPDHPNVAISISNLGGVMQDIGDLVGAQMAYERALTIRTRIFPPDHPDVKMTQKNLDSLK